MTYCHGKHILLERKPNHKQIEHAVQYQCVIVKEGFESRCPGRWRPAHSYTVLKIFLCIVEISLCQRKTMRNKRLSHQQSHSIGYLSLTFQKNTIFTQYSVIIHALPFLKS